MRGQTLGMHQIVAPPMRTSTCGARCVHHYQSARTRRLNAAGPPLEISAAQQAPYFFGGLIMMCAPAVPGFISHGAPSLALVDSPVDWVVAKGT